MQMTALPMQGGIKGVHENNKRKAQTVYDAIAGSGGFYANPVDPAVQSLMNVPFTIPSNPDLEKEFISGAAAAGLVCVCLRLHQCQLADGLLIAWQDPLRVGACISKSFYLRHPAFVFTRSSALNVWRNHLQIEIVTCG